MSSKDPDRPVSPWRHLEEVFQAALDHPPAGRRAYLDSACAGEADLRREVDELIEALARSAERFDKPVLIPAEALIADPAETGTPSSIGGYTLLRILGRGGMGSIYLGESDNLDPPRVAIKLIDPDVTDRERFDRERRVISRLQHPNIARLLDKGQSEAGREYLIMEYVEGVAIDRHCDRARLSLEARLELFRQVCATVHYAHQNLVIHLDLKPENVLVTEDGTPKLIDFGISEILTDRGGGRAVEAADETRPLTPSYASPEQLRGDELTPASDVYSLGVLLYLLVAGHLPRPAGGGKLRALLQGDVGAIARTAMATDPADRYDSAEGLAEEIGRYLEKLPVLARRPSFTYVTGKFLQRHRMAATMASLSFLLLVLLAIAASWQTRRIAHERDREALEKKRAEQVSEFMVGLFELADPIEGSGEGISARHVIDLGAARLADSLDGQPLLKAKLSTAIGRVYLQLGTFREARQHLENALRINRDFGSPVSIAESLFYTARIDRIEDRIDQAEKGLLEAIGILEGQLDESQTLAAAADLELGRIHFSRGDLKLAESFMLGALESMRKANVDRPEIAAGYRALAALYRSSGRYDEAAAMGEQSLKLSVEVFGEDHVHQAGILVVLGDVYRLQGDFERAKQTIRRALTLYEDHLGPDHVQVANALNYLGIVFGSAGQLEEARRRFERSLSISREAYGDSHRQVAHCLSNLAVLEDLLGRHESAIRLYQETVERYSSLFGPESSAMASVLSNLGTVFHERGELDRAEIEYRKALAIYEHTVGSEHDRVANLLAGLGDLERLRGETAAATVLLERAVETFGQVAEDHPDHAWALRSLGLVKAAAGHPAAAAAELRRAREIYLAAAVDPLNPDLLDAEIDLARTLARMGRAGEATALLQDVVVRSAAAMVAEAPNLELVARVGGARLALYELEPDTGAHLDAALELLGRARDELFIARRDLSRALWYAGAEEDAAAIAGELWALGLRDEGLGRMIADRRRQEK